jgi:acyl-CoA reductase-like NAD-dependent aldehyde dehydrogenase
VGTHTKDWEVFMGNLLAEVSDFLASGPMKLFIGGQWVDAGRRGTLETRDPGTGKVLAEVAAAGQEDVNRAVEAAQQAFKKSGWPAMPANDRAVVLHRLADLIDKHRDILAEIESLDVGKPIVQAAGDVLFAAQTFRYYADLSVNTRRREPIAVSGHEAYTLRVPYGACAFIFPWNFPFLLLSWGISAALAAGNSVVVKPAEDTPLSTIYFCRLAQQAGVPDGVINVLPGYGEPAGAALAAHPGIRRMSFTGSPEVGRSVAAACGANLVPVKLELGGKGAAVLFDDVDVDQTASALVSAVTFNTGQVCCTATRWLVHESIWDQLVERAKTRLEQLNIGYSLSPGTEMGPVVSPKQKDRVLGYLQRGAAEGASALLRGGEAEIPGFSGGFYVKPALLTGSPDNVCAREEIFGPVAYLMPFKTEDEAVDLVNRSFYGLANSVWSKNLDRAHRVAEAMIAGNSWINAHNVFKHGIPYAGANLSGLGGGVLGPETLHDYLRPQSVVQPV